MKKSEKAKRLSQQIGRLWDSLYEEFGVSAPAEILDARLRLVRAADDCLVASHFLQERESREDS